MNKVRLSLGMAVHTDFNGVYFTVQSLRLYHAEVMDRCELIVVDNNPGHPEGKMTAEFLGTISGQMPIRYIPFTEAVGTSVPRDMVFREAKGNAVLCMDSHVQIAPGALKRLIHYYDQNQHTCDLLSGPMLLDNLVQIHTHFADQWRAEMWGTWDTDPRGLNANNPPFEIPAMGLGLFTCRKDAWLGFNPNFRGFGGEEFYIHEKFRQAGAKCLCLPFLRWGHRFGRPQGVPYPLNRWNKIRNYVIGHTELGLPLDRVKEHFVDSGLMPVNEWEALVANPTMELPNAPTTGCGGCGGNPPASEVTLEKLYEMASKNPSDINEHAEKLKELSSQCESVVEFGMRHGVSTVALLSGQPKKFVSYGSTDDPMGRVLKQRQGATEFDFKIGNSLTAEIDECDLLFIDTRHTADQLYAELTRHAPKVRRWIAMHDTTIFGEKGEDGGPGLLPALRRFMTEFPEWSVIYDVMNNHGFTVISRDKQDKPELPGMVTMAWNFSKALAAHVADGVKTVDVETMQQRLEICSLCLHRVDGNCSRCGCVLAEKTKWRTAFCPIGKWSEAKENEAKEEVENAK